MRKRGQVSVFIIIGVIILFAIIFIFALIGGFQDKVREITNPKEYLSSQMNDVRKAVISCIDTETKNALNVLSSQGGYFEPDYYTNYFGNKVAFLCYRIKPGESCYNMFLTRSQINEQLGPRLENGIKSCVDNKLVAFNGKDYTLTKGSFGFDYEFSEEFLLVNLDYPITLKKGNFTETRDKYSKETRTNFWKKFMIALDIVNSESKGEDVDIIGLSVNDYRFSVERREIIGGNLYVINSRISDDPPFYFAVEP